MPDDTITQAELADLRSATESWFTDILDIYRGAVSSDPYGGEGEGAEGLVAQAVPCAIESSAEHVQERALLAIIGDVQAFTVTVPAETDIQVDDRVVLTSRGNDSLRVQAVMAPESWEIERRVIATELG